MFEVVVFVACRRAEPEGSHGPGSLARLPYTLEGVGYTFAVDLGDFPFPGHSPVTSGTVAVRDLELPRRGRYELRLLERRPRPSWRGRDWRRKSSHYIAVE